jgi:hypothetical protein
LSGACTWPENKLSPGPSRPGPGGRGAGSGQGRNPDGLARPGCPPATQLPYDAPVSSLPAGAQPVLPQPERTPAAIRAAVARLAPGELGRFDAEWADAMTQGRDEFSLMPPRRFIEVWWLWAAVRRWPLLAARLLECERIAGQAGDRETRRAIAAEIGQILETAAKAA